MSAPDPSAWLAADTGSGIPAAETDFSLELVAVLLADQHSDLAHEPLRLAASGWDNWMVRIGDHDCARLPRRAVAAELLAAEQAHLPRVAPHLPLAVPVPVRTGLPGRGYPWDWSITRWIDGATVADAPLNADQGPVLAGFLRALHQMPVEGLPPNPARNGPLARVSKSVAGHCAQVGDEVPAVHRLIAEVWEPAVALQTTDRPVWLHGDLHARNLLSRDGRLVAAIDWGDTTAGEAFYDLASVWLLLDHREARQAALDAYEASPTLILQAKAWALRMGLLLATVWQPMNDAQRAMGLKVLDRLAADFD